MVITREIAIHPTKGIVIRYNGVFDIDSLYKDVKSWFKKHSYDYFEKENTEKTKPQGNTLIIKMRARREIDDYVQFRLEIDFEEILRIKKVEKGHSGEARIIIRGFIDLDYHNNWKALPFLFYLYNNIILKKKVLEYYWPKIYGEMMELNSLIKTKLGLIR